MRIFCPAMLASSSLTIAVNQVQARGQGGRSDNAVRPGAGCPTPGRTLQSYLMILVTRPAPTVRPPSRMAKRRPSSMAIGWVSPAIMSGVLPGQTHLATLGEGHDAGHVGGAEVELRAVVVEERRVTAALLLRQDVDRRLEVRVRGGGARLDHDHAALDVLALGAAKQQPDVLAGLALVEQLAEHLDARDGRALLDVADADDVDGLVDLDDAAL